MVFARGWGAEGMGSYCSMGTVSVLQDAGVLVLELDGGDGCTTM